MKLNVGDRVALLKIIPLPKEGNRLTFKLIENLISEVSFSEKDFKDFGIIEKDGMIHWGKSEDKEIEIGEKAMEIIKDVLYELDKASKLDRYTYLLYEKFIGDGNS